jgi:uncharacterized damage-inducible protein DinB
MIGASLLPEFDQEMVNTRKALERIPDDKLDYKPHDKSGTMGWLGVHLAMLAGWGHTTLKSDSFDVAPPGEPAFELPKAGSRAEILEMFDRGRDECRAAIAETSDAEFMKPWSLLQGGAPLFTMPRVAVFRGMIMNHLIHHRGQLTVYLRLNNIPVPALYGPSADEAGV